MTENETLVILTLACLSIGYLIVGVLSRGRDGRKLQLSQLMSVPYFRSTKKLGFKDELLLSMLESTLEKGPCFVVTDPALPDNPIIYASPAFCAHTGYSKEEVENRNCRFLQGPGTSTADIAKIREAVEAKKGCSVCLLNYRKDGSSFVNQFFLTPLFEDSIQEGQVAYFLGVQAEVSKREPNHDKENPGFKIMSYFRE